jgi:cell division septation protein DedD
MWSDQHCSGLGYTDLILDESLKERLTGAAILVGLVVALVPEMFRGSHTAAATLPIPSAGSGAPIQTYTIDLNAAPMTPSLAPAPPATATPLPATTTGVAVASPPPVASASAVVAPAPQEVAPLAAIASGASAALIAPSAPIAMPPVAKPAPKPAKPAAAGAQHQWVVQVGSFTLKENATRMVKQAAQKGIRVNVAGPDARGMFRVRTAAVGSRQAALEQQAQLKSQGLNGIINSVD